MSHAFRALCWYLVGTCVRKYSEIVIELAQASIDMSEELWRPQVIQCILYPFPLVCTHMNGLAVDPTDS